MYLTVEDEQRKMRLNDIRDYFCSHTSQKSFLTVLCGHKPLHSVCLNTERTFQVVTAVISSMQRSFNVKTSEIIRIDVTL